MTDHNRPAAMRFDENENIGVNPTGGPDFTQVLKLRLSRRGVGQAALALTALAAGLPLPAPARAAGASAFSFKEAEAGEDETHHVAEGYDADVLIRWGDKVLPEALPFTPDRLSAAAQAAQFGYNNDFVGYIPLEGSKRGLLVVNHEYTNEELIFPGLGDKRGKSQALMTPEQVEIEMMAHGGSVIEIARGTDGKWSVVEGSRYARRITAETPMRISGPAAGHPLMKTHADATGAAVLGTINNCAGGLTPWGTWLTCEENINGYFWNKAAAADSPLAKDYKRYGAPAEAYGWGRFHDRFDVSKEPNEIHRFGWVVEIDPFDPASTPIKRTALGRMKHEGAAGIANKDGRYVVYLGDDERFEYVYRFVTAGRISPDRAMNRDLLDTGVLSVARFNADGSGEWLPLIHGQGPLTAENGFADQGAVLIRARQAADLLGATKMDRPEDVEASPLSNKVYVVLTNNDRRKADQIDAANPRGENKFGHIIEMTPKDGDHAAASFAWDILVKCGDPAKPEVGASFNPLTSKDGWFGMPDNVKIDAKGRLWVATDGMNGKSAGRADGLFALDTEGSARGTSKLLYRVPVGAEMCGPETTPDLETMFVAVQHPGEGSALDKLSTRWPDFKDGVPPRPAIVAITRKGGGKIAV